MVYVKILKCSSHGIRYIVGEYEYKRSKGLFRGSFVFDLVNNKLKEFDYVGSRRLKTIYWFLRKLKGGLVINDNCGLKIKYVEGNI